MFLSTGAIVPQNAAGSVIDLRQEITVLARGTGDKPQYKRLFERGARVVSVNLDDDVQTIAASLNEIDIVLVSIPPDAAETQIPLARAAKLAGVKRFVPSSFAMALSPEGSASVQKSVRFRPLNDSLSGHDLS